MATESLSQTALLRLRRSGRWRLFAISYACFLVLIALVAACFAHWPREQARRAMLEGITRNLTQKARLIANRINVDRAHTIDVIAAQEGQAAGARVTVIDTNGQVVADSEVAASSLQDEGGRAEFVAALHGSDGIEIRARNGADLLFVAVPVSGGAVRLAYPLSDVDVVNEQVSRGIFLGCALAAFVALGLSASIALVVPLRSNFLQV